MEAKAVAQALGCSVPGPRKSTTCTTGGLSVHLYLIGMGARQLPELTETPDAVLLAGLAGSIDSRYGVGDVVVGMTSTWLPGLPYPKVGVCYSDQPMLSAHSKYCAAHATGDQIVEMESEPVKRWAQKRGYPLLHLRAISDGDKEDIDPVVMKMMDPFGHAKPIAILKAMVAHPNLVPQLKRLNDNSKKALTALAKAMRQVVRVL